MIHPSANRTGVDRPVRDGHRAPVTCASCGCRLESVEGGGWAHFGRFDGRDARGCRVGCIESAHDARGRAFEALPA